MAEHHTTPGHRHHPSLQHGRPAWKGRGSVSLVAVHSLQSSAVPVLAEALRTAVAEAWVGLAG